MSCERYVVVVVLTLTHNTMQSVVACTCTMLVMIFQYEIIIYQKLEKMLFAIHHYILFRASSEQLLQTRHTYHMHCPISHIYAIITPPAHFALLVSTTNCMMMMNKKSYCVYVVMMGIVISRSTDIFCSGVITVRAYNIVYIIPNLESRRCTNALLVQW